MRTPLTHVLFDFFGTLVNYSESRSEQGFPRSYQLLLAAGARLPYAEFIERWTGTFDEFERHAERSLDEYSMDAVCREFLARVLARVPDDAVIAEFRDTYLDEWNRGVEYRSDVPALLNELSERFVLVLVTNTHHANLVHGHLRRMEVIDRFAAIVTSIEHGRIRAIGAGASRCCMKPVCAWRRACSQLKCRRFCALICTGGRAPTHNGG